MRALRKATRIGPLDAFAFGVASIANGKVYSPKLAPWPVTHPGKAASGRDRLDF